jgi:HPt (histidine-containing phosphotransfer) domain-containing protein
MNDADTQDAVLEALAHIWADAYADAVERLTVIEYYCAAVRTGRANELQRGDAAAAAHKLAGTLGTFGFPTGSDYARSIDGELSGPSPDEVAVHAVVQQTQALHALLDAAKP